MGNLGPGYGDVAVTLTPSIGLSILDSLVEVSFVPPFTFEAAGMVFLLPLFFFFFFFFFDDD